MGFLKEQGEMTNNEQEKLFNAAQLAIAKSYEEHYGISAEHLSFEGSGNVPSFDHEAISILSLRLTDLADIRPISISAEEDRVIVFSEAVLQDGRKRGGFGSCSIGERLANGSTADSRIAAEGVALSRSFRQVLRNVGIDLHRSHQRFLQTGEIVSYDGPLQHPRAAQYREIHALATELGFISEKDDALFRGYIAGLFNGRTSKEELTDIEVHTLQVNLRANVEAKRQAASKEAA